MSNNNLGKNSSSDNSRIILIIITIFTWFIGALLYLFMIKPKGLELVVCILACFIPVIPGVILLLNAIGVINIK